MAKKPEPFNNPFAKVKLDEPKKGAPARAPAPPRVDPKKAILDDEAALFLESVGEVARVKVKTARVAPKNPPTAAELRLPSEDAESLARLAELVSGETFEVSDSTEFIEGSVQGFDERVMKKLRRGEFSHRAELDLHGKTREQARPALEKFIGQRYMKLTTRFGAVVDKYFNQYLEFAEPIPVRNIPILIIFTTISCVFVLLLIRPVRLSLPGSVMLSIINFSRTYLYHIMDNKEIEMKLIKIYFDFCLHFFKLDPPFPNC